jgi:hypothetical protein
MRIRFTIRDVLWLTLVVALVIGWRLDRERQLARMASITIDPLTILRIEAGTPKHGNPVTGNYLVEPGGMLNLGPAYGKVKVSRLTCTEAEIAVLKQLRKTSQATSVSIKIADRGY